MNAQICEKRSQNAPEKSLLEIYYYGLMRAYLPISHKELEAFVLSKSIDAVEVFAPTPAFIADNLDCDEEEREYLLSVAAGEEALELRLSEKAPGIVLAFEITDEQIAESYQDSVTLKSALPWEQLQCALLAFQGDDELVWFATQEIEIHLAEWR